MSTKNLAVDKLAKILRCDKETLLDLDKKMSVVSKKTGVLDGILKDNDSLIDNRLLRLGLNRQSPAKDVYSALIKKIYSCDKIFVQKLGNVSAAKVEDCQKVLDAIKASVSKLNGYFLKKDKARELLIKEPPRNILQVLNYQSVEEMLKREDIFEIFAALRFIENNDWLNNVFFKQYESLTPADFEEREVEIRALGQKWSKAAESFVQKKYHNISHLKEFGVIFVIPVALNIPGEILRMISMVYHYYYEVKFYSDIFRSFSQYPDFAQKLIAILKGDLANDHIPPSNQAQWLIIQQYLAKNDENDKRLFEPHLNPEAMHWENSEREIVKLGEIIGGIDEDFSFWSDLGWVGDYFSTEVGIDVLVSFNIVDAVMSLVKEKEMVKYLYHHQEALWNKIFIGYLGQAELEKQLKNNLLSGFIQL
ncbi:MAG TPA: hypothetical protein PKZ02_01425 [Candidatus Paceibacterota bacterium]|nr:hypothetical protein [Candidatus Paceibacterota bacterium]